MKRRDKGAGTLYQRSDGTWAGQVELPPGPNGKRRRKSVYGKTKAEVQAKIKAALAEAEQGRDLGAPRKTLAQFLAYWLEEVIKPHRRASTYRMYEQIVRCYITPHLGHHQLDRLTPAQVQQWLNTLQAGDLAPRTIHHALSKLRQALTLATRQGYISRNVAQLVDAPRVPTYQGQSFTVPQAKAFLAATHGHRLAPLYHLALYRGLREGELLALRWADVNLDAGTLRVADAKTPAGERTIPLGADLVRMLREHWAWLQEERLFEGVNWKEHGLVFPTGVGTPMSARNLVRHFKSVLKKAGLPDIRFHDLRHSCATLLAAEGTPPAVAMKILGHSQVSTTLEIYTHADLTAMQEWLTRLDDSLRA
jgi:integrase